jgi:hypothetical protein
MWRALAFEQRIATCAKPQVVSLLCEFGTRRGATPQVMRLLLMSKIELICVITEQQVPSSAFR